MRNRNSFKRGSIFTAMLAAVVVIGLLGTTVFNRMIGPVSTMSRVNNRLITEEHLTNSGRALIRASSDCDSDGKTESPPFVSGSGPTGGGFMPTDQGVHTTDVWGTKFGYCTWDVGATSAAAGCGVGANRLDGTNDPSTGDKSTTTQMALISAGPDRVFQTTCVAYTNGTTPVLTPGGDDVVVSYTSADAEGTSGGGGGSALWSLKGGDPDTGTISKKLEFQGSTAFQLNYLTGDITFDDLSTTPGRFIADGGITLPYAVSCAGVPCASPVTTGELMVLGGIPKFYSPSSWKNFGHTVSAGSNPWSTSGTTISTDNNLVVTAPTSIHAALNFPVSVPTSTADYILQFVPAIGAFRAGYMGNADWYSSGTIGTYSFSYGTRLYARNYASIALGGAPSSQSIDNNAAGAWLSGSNSVITGPDTIGGFVHGGNHNIGNRAHHTVALGVNLDVTSSGSCTIDSNCAQNNILIGRDAAITWSAGDSARYNVVIGDHNASSHGGSYNVIVKPGLAVQNVPAGQSGTLFLLGQTGTAVRFNDNAALNATGSHFLVNHANVAKTASGNWSTLSSDMRLKNITGLYESGLDAILGLRTVVYRYKKDNPYGISPEDAYIGFIAQEVQKVLPEAVRDSDEDGYLEVSFDPIEYALVNATKDMDKLQTESEAGLSALENRVDALARKLGTPGSSWQDDINLPGTALVVSLFLPLALMLRGRRKF